MTDSGYSRRRVLQGLGVGGAGALAGCMGQGDDEGSGPDDDQTPSSGDDTGRANGEDSSNGTDDGETRSGNGDDNGQDEEEGSGDGTDDGNTQPGNEDDNGTDSDTGDGEKQGDNGSDNGQDEPDLGLTAEFLDGEDVILDTRNRTDTVNVGANYNEDADAQVNLEVEVDGDTIYEETDIDPGIEELINLNYSTLLEEVGPGNHTLTVQANSGGQNAEQGITLQITSPEDTPHDPNTERILEGMSNLPEQLELWYVTDGKTLRNMTNAEYGGVGTSGKYWALPLNLDKVVDGEKVETLDQIIESDYIFSPYQNLMLAASSMNNNKPLHIARFDPEEIDWIHVEENFLPYLNAKGSVELPDRRELEVYELDTEEGLVRPAMYLIDEENDIIVNWNGDHDLWQDALESLYGDGGNVLERYPEVEDAEFMDETLFGVSGGRSIPLTSKLGDQIGFVGDEYDGVSRVYDEQDDAIVDTERQFVPGGKTGGQATADPEEVSQNWLGR